MQEQITICQDKRDSYPNTAEYTHIRKLYNDLIMAIKKGKTERIQRLQIQIFGYVEEQNTT